MRKQTVKNIVFVFLRICITCKCHLVQGLLFSNIEVYSRPNKISC